MDLGYYLENEVLRKCFHLRPVLDVRSELDLCVGICNALGIENSVLIDLIVECVSVVVKLARKCCSGCENALVCSCCGDGSCVHECNGRDLAALNLGAFSVREVSCGVTDGECIVCRCIARTEARSAECCLKDSACLKESCCNAVLNEFHVDRC